MKNSKLILAIAVLLILATVYAIKQKPTTAPINNDYEVKIGYYKLFPATMALRVAIDNGYFDQANIKIKTIEYSSANQIVDALVKGEIDISPYTSISPVLNAELIDPGKIKIFSLSDVTFENRVDAILVKSDTKLKSINDLSNKKIGVFPGNTATGFLKMYLTSKNIDTSTIEFVQIPANNQLAALESSSVDALFTYEPLITTGIQNFKMKTIDESVMATVFNHTPLLVDLISTNFINSHPELASKVTQIFHDTYKNIKNNNQLARDSGQKFFNFDKNIADNLPLTYVQETMDKSAFNAFVDLLVQYNELKNKPNLSNIFYK